MANTIIMSKYQGLGNDYLILDPKKNQVQLQGKKIALLCQRGFGLGADGVLYGPVEIDGKLGIQLILPFFHISLFFVFSAIPLFFGIAMVFYFSEFKRSVCTPSRTMRSPSPSVQK